MSRPGRESWPFAALALLVLSVFGRFVAAPSWVLVDAERPSRNEHVREEDQSVGNDLTRLFWPHHLKIARAIEASGLVPAWDPSGFGGRPLIGNPQAGLWYPPVWMVWLAGGHPAALGWLTVAHLLLAGAGALVLARLQGLRAGAAFIAAAGFSISPYLLGHVHEGHLPHIWGVAWYPWAFAAVLWWRQRGWRAAILLPPLLAASLLCGHVQEGYYLLVALTFWVAFDVAEKVRQGAANQAVLRVVAWGVILLFVLGATAPEWMTTAALRPWLHRGTELSLREASRYHLSLSNLLQLLNPRALGGPAEYFGRDNYWEIQAGPGWVTLVLAIIAVARARRRRAIRAWTALALLALVFAAGRRAGLFTLCYHLLPGVSWFRVPARSLFLASLAVSQLAAHGLDTLLDAERSSWRTLSTRYARCVLVIAVGLLAASGLDQASLQSLPFRSARALAGNAVFWSMVIGLGLALGASRTRRFGQVPLAALVGGLLVAELASEGFLLIHVAAAERFQGPDRMAEFIERTTPPELRPPRVRARDSSYPDLRVVSRGFEKTNLNDYFQLQQASDLYESLYPVFDRPGSPSRPMAPTARHEARRAVLDRMSVFWLISDRPLAAQYASGLDLVSPAVSGTGWTHYLYRNNGALPRAYVVPRGRPTSGLMKAHDELAEFDGRTAALLAGDPLPEGPRQPFTVAAYEQLSADRVQVRVTTSYPGLLVVSDTWLPGWKARVDGVEAVVMCGNHCQRVVALPGPGLHRVEMWYEPPRLTTSLKSAGASGLAWLGCVLVVAVSSVLGSRRIKSNHAVFEATTPRSAGPRRAGRTASCPRA